MKIVNRIEVETFQCIPQIGRRENEACVFRQARRYLQTVDAVHLYIQKNDVGPLVPDSGKPFRRVAECLQLNVAYSPAELLDYVEGRRFVVDGDVIFGSGAFNTVPGMTLYDPATGLYGGKHSDEMILSIQSIDGNTAGCALNIVGRGRTPPTFSAT